MEYSNDPYFTNRKINVLNLLVLGFTDKDMAIDFSLRRQTVEFHIQNILSKLRAENRAQVIIKTIKNDWIEV